VSNFLFTAAEKSMLPFEYKHTKILMDTIILRVNFCIVPYRVLVVFTVLVRSLHIVS